MVPILAVRGSALRFVQVIGDADALIDVCSAVPDDAGTERPVATHTAGRPAETGYAAPMDDSFGHPLTRNEATHNPLAAGSSPARPTV